MPGDLASPARVAFVLVKELQKRGMIQESFFAHITELRPMRSEEIAGLAGSLTFSDPRRAPNPLQEILVAEDIDRLASWLCEGRCAGSMLLGEEHAIPQRWGRTTGGLTVLHASHAVQSYGQVCNVYVILASLVAPPVVGVDSWTPEIAAAIEFATTKLKYTDADRDHLILAGRRDMLTAEAREYLSRNATMLRQKHVSVRTYDWLLGLYKSNV